ncbi:MAG: DUF1294 domain-containing protein [Clostridia bacterium]|nr:DUF1294 domain-containing protein [Clostridia bacterium]
MKPLLLYLVFVNVVAVAVCAIDKLYAIKGWYRRRVRETQLFVISFLGGALGMYVTMKLIRHKTLHKRFMITLPILILVQSLLLLYVLHLIA